MPRYLNPFTADQRAAAEIEVRRLARSLQGRKVEEGDWTDLYCRLKGVPSPGWSNLPFRDYLHEGVGVEFKLLCKPVPAEHMGRSLMHPSATRTINFDENDTAAAATRAVLQQWGKQIEGFRRRIAQTSASGSVDARWGVLIWASDHSQFLYFEEELEKPDHRRYEGRWVDGTHRGKPSRNLHIFEKGTDKKRFSCTLPRNGAKLQPYFDVPTIKQGAILFEAPPLTTVPLFVERADLERMREIFPGVPDEEVGAKVFSVFLEMRDAFKRGKTADVLGADYSEVLGLRPRNK